MVKSRGCLPLPSTGVRGSGSSHFAPAPVARSLGACGELILPYQVLTSAVRHVWTHHILPTAQLPWALKCPYCTYSLPSPNDFDRKKMQTHIAAVHGSQVDIYCHQERSSYNQTESIGNQSKEPLEDSQVLASSFSISAIQVRPV